MTEKKYRYNTNVDKNMENTGKSLNLDLGLFSNIILLTIFFSGSVDYMFGFLAACESFMLKKHYKGHEAPFL